MRVFLDSNVFIWGYNRPDSNSARILELMDNSEITVVVSEKVMEEVRRYFLNYYNKDVWSSVLAHISPLIETVFREEIDDEVKKWKGKIAKNDLEHLATAKLLKLDYLISCDDDFKAFKEHATPKQFIGKLGLKESATKY